MNTYHHRVCQDSAPRALDTPDSCRWAGVGVLTQREWGDLAPHGITWYSGGNVYLLEHCTTVITLNTLKVNPGSRGTGKRADRPDGLCQLPTLTHVTPAWTHSPEMTAEPHSGATAHSSTALASRAAVQPTSLPKAVTCSGWTAHWLPSPDKDLEHSLCEQQIQKTQIQR